MVETTVGRFTARGGAAVEAEIAEIVRRAGELVDASVPRRALRALLLVGGYGRGEGGVERRGGVERPHNNLDFLLVTRGVGRAPQASKRRLDELFRPLAEAASVGIDTGVIGELRLRAAPCLVRWYDLRLGHKTVAGDPGFASSLTRFRAEAIEPADVLDLLVNRGSLLVLNELLGRGAGGEPARRAIVRHGMKAILGYGDACLFALGAYHVSYAERQRRMRTARPFPAAFRALYDEASEFRFEPSYHLYADRDLEAWAAQLTAQLEPMHLVVEAWRLGAAGLTWDGYAERVVRRALLDAPRSALSLARAGTNLFRGPGPSGLGPVRALALRAAGSKTHLAIALPAVLYGAGGERYAELARSVLRASDASRPALRRAYLQRWGEHGDTNLGTTAHGLRRHPGLLEAA
jgi:hypothetical protein